MKTTLDLPDDLIQQVKMQAVMQRRPLKDLVAEFLRLGLGIPPRTPVPAHPASSMIVIAPDGLPLIQCRSEAKTSTLSIETLLALEQTTQTTEDMQRAGLPL